MAPSLFKLGAVALAYTSGALAQQKSYQLKEEFTPANFFDKFTFRDFKGSGQDPNKGHVQYQSRTDAADAGLIKTFDDHVYIGVDSKEDAEHGRKSVRIESKDTYNSGLFVIEFSHLPQKVCGAWPAFWLNGDSWPTTGEVDIYEGWNMNPQNKIVGHTGAPGLSGICKIDKGLSAGNLIFEDCWVKSPLQPSNAGCAVDETNNLFGSASGGVWATEWTEDHFKVWSWAPNQKPANLVSGKPDPSTWGTPSFTLSTSSCDVKKGFKDMRMILNINFCGDAAGNLFSETCAGSTKTTCDQYVSWNKNAFKDVFWEVKGIDIYQLETVTVSSTSTSSASTTSTSTSSSATSTVVSTTETSTEASTTETSTEASSTEASSTEASSTEAASTEATSTDASSTEASVTKTETETSATGTATITGGPDVTATSTAVSSSTTATEDDDSCDDDDDETSTAETVTATATATEIDATATATATETEATATATATETEATATATATETEATATVTATGGTEASATATDTATQTSTEVEEFTTSTIYATTTLTFTSCAPTVTSCPARVVTSVVVIGTTVCPVTHTPSPSVTATTKPTGTVTPLPSGWTTSTIYSTKTLTIVSCAPTVPNCPGRVTTTLVPIGTTICPVGSGSTAVPSVPDVDTTLTTLLTTTSTATVIVPPVSPSVFVPPSASVPPVVIVPSIVPSGGIKPPHTNGTFTTKPPTPEASKPVPVVEGTATPVPSGKTPVRVSGAAKTAGSGLIAVVAGAFMAFVL